ncbi:macoilin [Lingula anatina]|uniref:Macoilin n=1 Tax=Lingula anatina TaxID=7574 RepID=A0A1S3HX65_LINAN|nr:macoilin [Lingula anatina]|eukprot:XP_013390620.1 macoilin [Lingula anatina]
MKRRNAECGKLRRPLKRPKITEGIYGSAFLYLKFLMVWGLVLMADFILEFRFEYLWPFWLLLRSVHDSFKYQGLAFSIFFVCIAITSDVVCYLFIPVQWLFFAASTYVWVQYVWHTERGICLPTVSLWLLFVYIEASIRLRELKSLPFNLDLCRPFAAHCIGYPVVTLGFGFKSYISYKLRLRKQKDVQADNDFYMQLLRNALPPEQQNVIPAAEKVKALPSKEEVISNGVTHGKKTQVTSNNSSNSSSSKTDTTDSKQQHIEDFEYIEQSPSKRPNVNDYDESVENYINDQHAKGYKANGVTKTSSKLNSSKDNVVSSSSKKGKSTNTSKDSSTTNNSVPLDKDASLNRLESDVKKLKADLQSSRNTEQELRSQINTLLIADKHTKSEMNQLRQDNEQLQAKLHNLVTSRQQDKQNLQLLEKKLQEERKQKAVIETQLATERKAKKAEEAAAARAVAIATSTRVECTENCKARRRDLENDVNQIHRELKLREDQYRHLEQENRSLRQYKDVQNETEVLMSALAAMQDKNSHLEGSLSAETKLKMDLFSALGETKREVEIQREYINQKERDIKELKSRIAEVMALIPSTYSNGSIPARSEANYFAGGGGDFTGGERHLANKSSLNPHAADYTPVSTPEFTPVSK